MLSVSLFGHMCVRADDQRVALSFGPRTRLFVGYLFEFPDRVHRRERLSDMFWDDLSPSAARAALNTALWRLRKLLAVDAQPRRCQLLQSRGDEIVLESSPLLRVDTHVFDGAVRDALETSTDACHKSRAATLQLAVAGYAGTFLDGDDADWVVAERERLHSLYIRCLCELMRTHAARDDYESAIVAGRRILAADQFRETVMRSLAILLFLNGQRARAIEELARWQMALHAQVGVSALPETRELHGALVSGSISDDLTRWRSSHLPPAP